MGRYVVGKKRRRYRGCRWYNFDESIVPWHPSAGASGRVPSAARNNITRCHTSIPLMLGASSPHSSPPTYPMCNISLLTRLFHLIYVFRILFNQSSLGPERIRLIDRPCPFAHLQKQYVSLHSPHWYAVWNADDWIWRRRVRSQEYIYTIFLLFSLVLFCFFFCFIGSWIGLAGIAS